MGFYPEKIEARCASALHGETMSGASCATAASFACGCYARFALDIDPEAAAVAAIDFRSNGCGFMIAATAVLAEAFHDTPLTDLHGLNSTDLLGRIQAALDAFPPERHQCAQIPIDALRAAFADHRARRITEFAGERALICTCFGVGEDTIEHAIDHPSVGTVDDVGSLTRAGTGCGSCQMLIQEMLDARELS
jgi:bacterioferritin-associated ferredoxin